MKRVRFAALLILAACGSFSATAAAHPLGNFSVNHLTEVRVSASSIDLLYILDQAEIPTFQERGQPDRRILTAKRDEVLGHLHVTVDGRPVTFAVLPGARISHPPGQGGLPLTRVELPLQARVSQPHIVTVEDQTFTGRIGWKAIVSRPGNGTDVHTDAPTGDPTNGLRVYPVDMLASPLDQRTATFSSHPGTGSLTAPKGLGPQPTSANRSGDGLAGVFSRATAGNGVLIFLLLAAFGWGALHALSPGHGKAMVAAYLVGARGTTRHAVALGGVVTFTHTIGVFALGAVTLLLSQYVLPEQIYPWLNLASGLIVLVIGAGVARRRIRSFRLSRTPTLSHAHHHHARELEHGHGPGQHSHDVPDEITRRGLLLMGASAGLIPCPSALVVLLGAIAQHQVGLGLLLITVFSLGLAMTLTSLGVAVVKTRTLTSRINFDSRTAAALPAASALVIIAAGLLLTAQALPSIAQ